MAAGGELERHRRGAWEGTSSRRAQRPRQVMQQATHPCSSSSRPRLSPARAASRRLRRARGCVRSESSGAPTRTHTVHRATFAAFSHYEPGIVPIINRLSAQREQEGVIRGKTSRAVCVRALWRPIGALLRASTAAGAAFSTPTGLYILLTRLRRLPYRPARPDGVPNGAPSDGAPLKRNHSGGASSGTTSTPWTAKARNA